MMNAIINKNLQSKTIVRNPVALVPSSRQEMLEWFGNGEGKVCLLYGERPVFSLSLYIAAFDVMRGTNIAFIDGCNRFDVHFFVEFARQRKINPDEFLKHIFVTRGFTCYQMEAAINDKLFTFLQSIGSSRATIFGLLDTFYDEQASLSEVQQILQRLLIKFQYFKEQGITLLLTCPDWKVFPPERNRLFLTLKRNVDKVFHLILNEEQKPKLFLETPNNYLDTKGVTAYGKNSTYLHQPY
jgi:hypothetical protein